MNEYMEYSEIWSLPEERIKNFFEAELITSFQNEVLKTGDCTVILESLPNGQVFTMPVPRTRVTICGEKDAVEVLHRKFFYTFISAGG